jgi:23S rRNA (guanosine2251-2'-O)-methyltransferase
MSKNVIYGRNALEEALRAGGRVNQLLVAFESRAGWVDALVEAARAQRVRVDFVPQARLNRLAHSRDHEGAVAVVSPVGHLSLDECLEACGKRATLLAVDEVQNPRNLGMLLRTALGAGVAGVLIPQRGGRLLSDEVARASAGAAFHVPVVYCGNTAHALRQLKEQGFWIYGLDARGDTDVFKVEWPDRTALVVGKEATGLRPVVRKSCDFLVRIPLAGGLDSLNVAVAAGIALFAVAATRRDMA